HYLVALGDGTILRIAGDGRLMERDQGDISELDRRLNDSRDPRRIRERAGYEIRIIPFDTLPREVRDTVRREQGRRDIRRIESRSKDNQTHYIVSFDNGELLRIGQGGRVLNRDK